MRTKRKRSIVIIMAAVLLLAVFIALFFTGIIKINTPSLAQYPVRGVDVSEYQGVIDWQEIERQGIQFAFIKATEGSSYVDPFFADNWQNVADSGILHGAYHFFSFDSPAGAQAESFMANVSYREGMLPPVVDIELYGRHKNTHPGADAVRAELRLLLDALENQYGTKPILYATQQSYALYLEGYYAEYPLWIRDVFFTPKAGEWSFWQYTDKGQLAGYAGSEKYIDINVFAGDLAQLRQMCLQRA